MTPPAHTSTDSLWAACQAGDEAAREQLIAKHLPLVYHIARKMIAGISGEADLDDLISAGTVGLINAVEAFDAGRGLAFSTYAAPRIRGAILDDLRRWDHAPRSVRRKQRQIAAAKEGLTSSLKRQPRSTETAGALGIDVETLWRWESESADVAQVPLDAPIDADRGHTTTPAELLVGGSAAEIEDRVNHGQEVELMKEALKTLPERERLVLTLYYFEELKLFEIADILDLTESRISQIRNAALRTVRAAMAPVRAEVAA
jgi:RNA polymerase sigma factor for flagellar operon FliA